MSGERIPILYLAPWVDLGGSDKGTIDWFRHLNRERFAPSLITTQPSDNRWLHLVEPYAEEIWDLPDHIPGHSFPGFILSFIEDRGVRIVHMMNSRLGFDLMPDMTNLHEPPVIVVQHHAEEVDRSGYVRYVSTRYGNLVDAFSVTSHQLREAMGDYDIAPSRVEVIHSGVGADDEFDPERVEPFEGLGEGRTSSGPVVSSSRRTRSSRSRRRRQTSVSSTRTCATSATGTTTCRPPPTACTCSSRQLQIPPFPRKQRNRATVSA